MNQLQAMRDTVAKMNERLADLNWHALAKIAKLDHDLQPQHIRDMLAVMEYGSNPQHPGQSFREAKMGRWLGWAQAAVVAQGLMTLEDMKAINMANAGEQE